MADMTDGFVKNTESTFGKPNPSRDTVRAARRVVVKVRLHAAMMELQKRKQAVVDSQWPAHKGALLARGTLWRPAAAAGSQKLGRQP